jgi:hypothetical protein
MVHDGKRLLFCLEPGHHLAGVRSHLDDLERNAAPHGLRLLGLVDDAHPAFAQDLQDPVVPYAFGMVW